MDKPPATFIEYLRSLANEKSVTVVLAGPADLQAASIHGKIAVFDDYVSVEETRVGIPIAKIVCAYPTPPPSKSRRDLSALPHV
jgi:hypothetical protein